MDNFLDAHHENFHSMNEIGINFKPECIKAIVIYSSSYSANLDYQPNSNVNRFASGANLAYLFREMVKERTEKTLPVIHYHIETRDSYPEVRQVTLEHEKVAAAIKQDPLLEDVFKTHLGEKKFKNLMLNKSNAEAFIG